MIRDPKLGEHRSIRPTGPHPDPLHWSLLRELMKERQRINGVVECGTCGCAEGDGYPFDLHHRYYDDWGREKPEHVILLCRPCHKAITSRIRNAQYAAGEKKIEPRTEPNPGSIPRFKAEERAIEVKPSYEVATPRFKAEPSY